MTTETHHRLNCTPAEFTAFAKIIDWMATDSEYADMRFTVDVRDRSIVAERLAWNCFKAASDVWATQHESHPLDAINRAKAVDAMLWEKSSRVEVEVVETVPKGALF